MFNFNFEFIGTSFPLVDIFLGVLTVGGTALATFLAAKYTGDKAVKTAEDHNEFQREENKRIEKGKRLNQLQISFNTLAIYVEDFYSSQKDYMRTIALDAGYQEQFKGASPKHRDYIDHSSIGIENIQNLGAVITNQTSSFEDLEITLKNNLLESKSYFKKEDFEEIQNIVLNITHYFKQVSTAGSFLSYTKEISSRLIAIQFVHMINDIGEVKSNREIGKAFSPSSEPYLEAYFAVHDNKQKVLNQLDKVKVQN